MSLRRRLALSAALAVTVAVLLASGAAFVVTRDELRSSVDRALDRRGTALQAVASRHNEDAARLLHGDQAERSRLGAASRGPRPPEALIQVVAPDGSILGGIPGEHLPVSAAVRDVAAGRRADRFFTDTEVRGVHERILTVPLPGGGAVELARPLDEVDRQLGHLAVLLVFVALGGIGLATLLGLAVARTALRPLDRLVGAVDEVATTTDLTRRVEATGGGELTRLADGFNRLLGALERSRQVQRQLVLDASHELRTPLTSLRTNVEVLQRFEDLPSPERHVVLADVASQLDELSALVSDVVELARDDERDAPPEHLRLDELVGAAVARAQTHARANGVVITVDAEPSRVRAVATRLERAVANMLDNAVKWSPPGSTVEVTSARGEVRVRDHGPGFAPEDLPHVFDRFYRAATARSLPGSGLGLAIVRQVVEEAGGTVLAENAGGGGAAVTIRLPALPAGDAPVVAEATT